MTKFPGQDVNCWDLDLCCEIRHFLNNRTNVNNSIAGIIPIDQDLIEHT